MNYLSSYVILNEVKNLFIVSHFNHKIPHPARAGFGMTQFIAIPGT